MLKKLKRKRVLVDLLETPNLPTVPTSLLSFSFTMDHQDWTTVVVRNPKTKTVERRDTSDARRLHKLDADEIKPQKKRLTADSRRDLAAARCALKKSQRDIDREVGFPANMIRDFEAGTAGPSGAQISALHRYFAAAKLVLKIETY
jgi:hypothetical protein